MIIDAHVHIYPQFDLNRAVRCSLDNFRRLLRRCAGNEDMIKIWMLTERSDCSFFQNALKMQIPDFSFTKTGQADALLLVDSETNQPLLYIIAGRQIVSSDNLEICALATTYTQPDKTLNSIDTIRAVHNAGGLAAINWAPGKWFGSRGKIVQNLLDTCAPTELFISDTTMRPTIWRTPHKMAAAKRRGFRVLTGSDPLPFAGEEELIASYSFIADGFFDADKPASSLRSALISPQSTFTICGRRSAPLTFAGRQYKIMAEKKSDHL